MFLKRSLKLGSHCNYVNLLFLPIIFNDSSTFQMNNPTSAWFSRFSSKVIRRSQKLYTVPHKLNTSVFQQFCKRWSYLPDIHFWQPNQIITVEIMWEGTINYVQSNICTIETAVPPDRSSYNMGLNTNLSDWSTSTTCNLIFFLSKLLKFYKCNEKNAEYAILKL